MLDASAYKAQAESNEAAAQSVEKEYPDWAITMCLYSALHWVNYHAAKNRISFDGAKFTSLSPHEKRQQLVRDIAYELGKKELRKAYDGLYNESMKSRYMRTLSDSAINHYKFAGSSVKSAFKHLGIIRDILGV